MKELKDKIIKSVKISGEYQDRIIIDTDNGKFTYITYGDCCSETYFSEVWNVKNMIGKKITEVEDLELVEGDAPLRKSRQEVDSIYGIRLKSKNDDYYDTSNNMTIIFRNSSNGYYGGNIDIGINEDDESKLERLEDISGLDNWTAPIL